MCNLWTISDAVRHSGKSRSTIESRIKHRDVRVVEIKKGIRYFYRDDLVALFNNRSGAGNLVTLREYATRHGLRFREVSACVAKYCLPVALVGRTDNLYIGSDIDDVRNGVGPYSDIEPTECARRGCMDSFNFRRGGICFNCWCSDYCKTRTRRLVRVPSVNDMITGR